MTLITQQSIRSRWRYTVATTSGCTAILAFAGAVALALGVIDMGQTINQRLPFRSPVLGGLALAIIVGVPMAVTALLAVSGDPRAALAAVGSGFMLIAWIAIEISFIQSFSWLQPAFVLVGAFVLAMGIAQRRR